MTVVKLGDICLKIGSGATPRGGKETYSDTGISLIRSQNVLDYTFSSVGLAHINEVQADKLKNVVVAENDVLLNITGDSVARACIVDSGCLPARVNQHVCIIRADTQYVQESYLLYFLQMNKQYLLQLAAGGATRNALTKEMICNLKIELPSLEEQRRTTSLLDSIQAKIEINKRINNNLEQQAQTIFRSMFLTEDVTTPATIADVALNVTDGVHNTVYDDPNGEYLLLSCKNIKGGHLTISSNERTINKDTFEKLRKRTNLSKGDVLISSVGTVGELLLLNVEPRNYEFQRSVAMIKPDPMIVSPFYIYESLIAQKTELINVAHGAVQQCLFIADIAGFPIGIPRKEDLVKFDSIVEPIFNAITLNDEESVRLSTMRTILLPKLMSGERDVFDIAL